MRVPPGPFGWAPCSPLATVLQLLNFFTLEQGESIFQACSDISKKTGRGKDLQESQIINKT